MISNLERRIITAAVVNQYNNGGDIAATLRSYSKLTYDEKNEIYKEIKILLSVLKQLKLPRLLSYQ